MSHRKLLASLIAALAAAFWAIGAVAADYPAPVEGDHVLKAFRFASGETLPELRIHYRTLGTIERNARGEVRNAVLILHGTGGNGGNFLGQRDGSDSFGAELFGPGQLLDATRHFIVLPDGIGHGRSSKPSDGLKGRFPRYGYRDMVEAQHRLLTEKLGVNHLRLVLGTSMGGMHAWLWGEIHPDFMDGLVPLASLPTQIAGRNRIWRRIVMDAIRNDPGWRGGDYETQPAGLRTGVQMLIFMGGNSRMRQASAPTLQAADEYLDRGTSGMLRGTDANDLLYALDASRDYDPGPALERIRAPLLAINFADDLINPRELGVLEREIRRVPKGQAVLIPESEVTVGHGTHTKAVVWKGALASFLQTLP
ncbi:MAG: alpha/beta fold hydrolase [Gammaproteobacteria bacterium]|nr:alpha/beta fold hydrolase [Gammaproteobacteria bacterium]